MTTLVPSPPTFWLKLSDYCNKTYQCITKNPRLFLMRKLARFEIVINCISWFYKLGEKSYEIGKNNPSIFKNINVDEVVSCLKTDSYYPGLNLPQDILQELLNFAYSTTCYGNRDPKLGFYYRQKEQIEAKIGTKFRTASYLKKAEICPAVKKLENDPVLLAIAAKFLGATPVHIATDLLWSFPVSATSFQQLKEAQVFHYDLDDYNFIKFFFYLTDVDPSSGPHICIRGTHKNKKFSHQLLGVRCASKDDREIVDCYGAENVVTICGKAGFGFAEDVRCFHKGAPPIEKERLLLQIEFAINKYGNIRDF